MTSSGGDRVLVWDAAVRLAHWSLAALVLAGYFVWDDGGPLHRQLGYAAATIVAARWWWGLVCTGPARLSAMRPSFADAILHAKQLVSRQAPHHLGHNPLGLWMVWLLWSLVLQLALTGWLSRLDAFWGDEWLQQLHAWLAGALIVAAALHLLGVLATSLLQRENLVLAMLGGRKRRDRLSSSRRSR